MGYTSITGADRKRTVQAAKLEREKSHKWECERGNLEVFPILFHDVPNGFWSLERSHYYGTLYIFFTLIEPVSGGYAWKTMGEGSGPYYYDCPSEFLDAAPPRNEKWRELVLSGGKR